MIQFVNHSNYRLALPLGGEIIYTVQQRTSKAVFLHNGKSKQFQKPVLTFDGVEFVRLSHHDYDKPLILKATNLVEKKG